MATRKLTSEDLRRPAKLAKGWGKIIVRQHWGEQWPGLDVDLAQMEEVAMAAMQRCWPGTLEVAHSSRPTDSVWSTPIRSVGGCIRCSTRSD